MIVTQEAIRMQYTDLIFDLYGTLVDIHTEENDLVWEKTALYFGLHGAPYTPDELRSAFQSTLFVREIMAGSGEDCYPDIPMESIIEELFQAKGVQHGTSVLGLNAAQMFRVLSIEYIKLYPGVPEALTYLRQKGYRLWLLSNAQAAFTSPEIRYLGLKPYLDGILLSSDYGCRKPDTRFFDALIAKHGLDKRRCLMIGNDRDTDIAGAEAAGLDSLYMHTNLTPDTQTPADPDKYPGRALGGSYEYEGSNWAELARLIAEL